MLHFTRQTSTLLNTLQCQEKSPPITPSQGVPVDPVVVSRDDREWTSACRRYVFIIHHVLRQTMADAVGPRREIKAALHPILLKNSPVQWR
jgi:hypothetical protein